MITKVGVDGGDTDHGMGEWVIVMHAIVGHDTDMVMIIIMHTYVDVDESSIYTANNIHLSIHPSIYLPPFSSYIYSVHRLITRLHINIVRPNSHYIKIDRRISITTTA